MGAKDRGSTKDKKKPQRSLKEKRAAKKARKGDLEPVIERAQVAKLTR